MEAIPSHSFLAFLLLAHSRGADGGRGAGLGEVEVGQINSGHARWRQGRVTGRWRAWAWPQWEHGGDDDHGHEMVGFPAFHDSLSALPIVLWVMALFLHD
jgi:hypothetical protein